MSSILEALRELEGTKPSSMRSRVAWAGGEVEERTPFRRASEILGVVAFGLVLGGAAFGILVWVGESGEPTPAARPAAPPAPPPAAAAPVATVPVTPPVAAPPVAATAPALAPIAPAPPAPAWLARMGAPRGRVADGGDARAAGRGDDVSAPPRAAGVSLVRVQYGESRAERSATLRIDGSPLVLHEGDSAYGIELQLVTKGGAYVRRGGEVLMLEPSR